MKPGVVSMRTWAAPAMEDLFRVTGLPVRAGLLEGSEVTYLENWRYHDRSLTAWPQHGFRLMRPQWERLCSHSRQH
jgi:hypothetical protein